MALHSPSGQHYGRHCYIKMRGVLAMRQSRESVPSGTLKNHNKPGI
jgi:hypothetical protein